MDFTNNGTALGSNLNNSKLNTTGSIPAATEYIVEATISRIFRWTVLIVITLLGGAGNTAVCVIAYRNKRMRNFTYSLITNLAVADLLSASIGIPIFVLNDYQQTWTMGFVMCKLFKPSFTLFNIVVTNTLVAIAFDRFRALVFPLSIKPGTTQTRFVLVLIWLVAFFCTLPSFGAMNIKTWEGYEVKICMEEFDQDENLHRLYSKLYATFLFLMNVLFPLFIIMALYVKITATLRNIKLLPVTMRILRRSSSDASTPSATPRHSWNLTNVNQTACNRRHLMEKRFIRMLMVVVLIFLFFYVPYQILFLVAEYHPQVLYNQYMIYLVPYLYVLLWAPVALNPICYGSMNARYKKAFRALMRCNKGKYLNTLRRRLSSATTFMSPMPPLQQDEQHITVKML